MPPAEICPSFSFLPVRLPARRAGFSLVELLVVIGLIAGLLAAVLVGVPKVKKAVYAAETQAQLSAISNAIQQYYNDFKSYPGPIPNSQLAVGIDKSGNGQGVYIVFNNASVPLKGTSGSTGSSTMASSADTSTDLKPTAITGAENLVLGLCGGLHVVPNTNSTNVTFEYHPQDIFAMDGVTPNPQGPASLNPNLPKKQQAYINIKAGDISVPNMNVNAGSFTDAAGRGANDSMVPEFVDKYADPLPILYYRTNVSGTAIVGFRNLASIRGSALFDQTLVNAGGPKTPEIAQYDLLQNYGYTNSPIGTISKGSMSGAVHGLIGIETSTNLSGKIDMEQNGTYVPSNSGSNAVAYFKDPSLNPPYDPTQQNPPNNTHLGVARQKDGYMLISAGADRLYGTHDDQVFPGPLQP